MNLLSIYEQMQDTVDPRKDTYLPPEGKWTFEDPGVAEQFDAMLEMSIPDYRTMRWLTSELAMHDLREEAVIADLGASRGGAIKEIYEKFPEAKFHAWESSEPMRNALNNEFSQDRVAVYGTDLKNELFVSNYFDRVLSVLTIMFTPIEYRSAIFQRIHNSLRPNGKLLLVEKTLPENSGITESFVKVYYDLKRKNGYSEDQIDRKRHSLEGVLVPSTTESTESMLRSAGFSQIQQYWRALQFVGWVAYK